MRDMRVIQRRQHLRLPLEACEAIGIEREALGQHLDRHVALQSRVARAIDFAHAAGADRGDDFIRAETSARSERHSTARVEIS